MGEASKRLKRLLAEQPYCVFCGGTTLGTTIDHVPPITVFDDRMRPKGMEFASCSDCNDGSRHDDLAIGLLSRISPDDWSDSQRVEMQKLLRGVRNNVPGLLEEMRPTTTSIKLFQESFGRLARPLGVPMDANGPILNRIVERFAAKLGLALHFKSTRRIAPVGGAVHTRRFSNYQAAVGDMPHDFLRALGPPETLRQGRFNVGEQYYHRSVTSLDGSLSAHFAAFRRAFAVAALVSENAEAVAELPPAGRFAPGFLR
jgi:hypothetical protein